MSHRAIKSVSFSLSASLPVFFHIWIPIFKLWCWVSCIEEKFLRWQSFFGDNSYFQHSHQQHSLQLMVSKQRSLVGYSLWKESFVHPWPMPNCRHNLENWFRKQMWLQMGNKLQKVIVYLHIWAREWSSSQVVLLEATELLLASLSETCWSPQLIICQLLGKTLLSIGMRRSESTSHLP